MTEPGSAGDVTVEPLVSAEQMSEWVAHPFATGETLAREVNVAHAAVVGLLLAENERLRVALATFDPSTPQAQVAEHFRSALDVP